MTRHGGNGKVKKTMKNRRTHCTFTLPPKKIYCYSTSSLLYSLYLSYNQVSQRYSLSLLPPPHHSLADINLFLQRSFLPSTPSPWLTKYEMHWVDLLLNWTLHSFLAPNKLGMIRSKPEAEEQASPKGKKSLLNVWHAGKTAPIKGFQEDLPWPCPHLHSSQKTLVFSPSPHCSNFPFPSLSSPFLYHSVARTCSLIFL